MGHFLRRSERADSSKWTNVYVKNLPEAMDLEGLEQLFSEYGEITSKMLQTNDEGVSKGFGFINFAEHDNARAAVEALNGKQLGADFRVCWREWD